MHSPWSLLQVLSGHSQPERCLLIGGIGARSYQSATALGRWPEIVEPEDAHKITGKFDMVVIAEKALENGSALTNDFLCRVLSPDGVCLRITANGGKKALRGFFGSKSKPAKNAAPAKTFRVSSPVHWFPQETYLLLGAHDWKNSAVASDQSPTALSNALVGDTHDFQTSLRKLYLRTIMTAGFPPAGLSHSRLIVYRARRKRWKHLPFISRARVTGRALTMTSSDSFFRMDLGCGSVKLEANLLEVLHNSVCSDYLISPEWKVSMSGLTGFRYEYFPGRAGSPRSELTYQFKALNFLLRLSDVQAPKFLEPARARLSRYIGRRLPEGESREEALRLLKVLSDRGVFRFVSHGEFRVGNLRIGENGKLKFVDWVQAYLGHPLMDWWRFVYDMGAPSSPKSVPEELQQGLQESEIRMLWTVWKAAYGL